MDQAKRFEILGNLQNHAQACALSSWPGMLAGLDAPGLYAWWADSTGSSALSHHLGASVSAGIIYAGQAGANRGKISAATLRSRLRSNHIGGKIRNSTFRLTIAAVLIEHVRPFHIADRLIGLRGEALVSQWMKTHLHLTVVPFHDRDELADVERQILADLDPPLNLSGMAGSPIRLALSDRRSELRSSPASL
jgi:hypothetical protein